MLQITKVEELKGFIFAVNSIDKELSECQTHISLAYNIDGACTELKNKLQKQIPFNFKCLGSFGIKELVDQIEGKEMTKNNFIASLKLTSEKFIINERDKKSFNRIISKII